MRVVSPGGLTPGIRTHSAASSSSSPRRASIASHTPAAALAVMSRLVAELRDPLAGRDRREGRRTVEQARMGGEDLLDDAPVAVGDRGEQLAFPDDLAQLPRRVEQAAPVAAHGRE